MFLKRLFRSSENPETPASTDNNPKVPPGHPTNLKDGDKAKCPFMNKSAKNGKDKSEEVDEEQQPRGGCPFMHSSNDQKNPGLQLTDQAFDSEMVSKYRYYLSKSKIDMYFLERKRGNRSREVFDNYPLYLQHTLFYQTEDLQKIRTFECCSRFMAYEELRERGNKEYNKGNYYASLDYYERALSLFKWLEHKEPEAEPAANQIVPSAVEICSRSEIQLSESEASRSRIEINLNNEHSDETERLLKAGPPKQKDLDEFRLKYKEFFVYYCDENTVLHDGEEMSETPDLDMRKSLMVQVYMNMAAAYIKLSHYSLARQCCDDARRLSDKMSQILMRKAQALSLNKSASPADLEEALRLIDQALINKTTEKIFTEVNKNILKMLNLQDFEEAYSRCREIVLQRIAETKEEMTGHHTKVFKRMEEIHNNEQEIIKSGRTPTERRLDKIGFESTDFRIITRMREKYLRVIDFYTESNKPEQVNAAKEQLQEILRVIHAMEVIHQVQLDDIPAELEIGDRASEKLQHRLAKVKQEQDVSYFSHSEVIYNAGRYNFEVLEWAVKEIVDEDIKKQEAEKKKKSEEEARSKAELAQSAPHEHVKPASPARYVWLLLLIPLLTILAHRFLL